jgi:hypothetical protein
MPRIAPAALRCAQVAAALLAFAAPARAAPSISGLAPTGSEIRETLSYAEHKATDILGQPVRDVGLFGRGVPESLQRAGRDPYGLAPASSCADIDSEIAQLDGALGPEPVAGERVKENRVEKMAEAGGRAAVNSLIPFRTVVREVSGAAPAERRLQAAISIGHERRGFLRGVYLARSCEPAASPEPEPQRADGEPD